MRIFVLENDSMMFDRDVGGEQAVVVGSSASCEISLPDSQIGERQLQLSRGAAGEWVLSVLDLRQPTRLNGAVITEGRPIKDRDEVALGRYVLKMYMSMDGRVVGEKSGVLRTVEREFSLPSGSIARSHGGILKISLDRLHDMTALTTELSSVGQFEQLADRILQQMLATFRGAAAGLCVRLRSASGLETVRGMDAKGHAIDAPALMTKLNERCTRFSYEICIPEARMAGVESAMAAPIVGARGAMLGMMYVETAPGGGQYDGSALDAFTSFAVAVAGPLDLAMHGVTQARTALADQGQVFARQVQDSLTIRGMPEWPDLHVAALRRPGVGRPRDFYDLLRLANRTVAIVLARIDATGAGLPRLMSEVRAAFRAACLHADAPHVLLRAVNWLVTDAHSTWSIDMACVWFSPESGSLKYCAAGDAITLGVISEAGEWRELERCGMPAVGKAKGFGYVSKSSTLEAGEVLALMTDGLDQLRGVTGEAFGRKRAAECLADTAGMAVNLMLSELSQELDEFGKGGVTNEDATIVLAGRRE